MLSELIPKPPVEFVGPLHGTAIESLAETLRRHTGPARELAERLDRIRARFRFQPIEATVELGCGRAEEGDAGR